MTDKCKYCKYLQYFIWKDEKEEKLVKSCQLINLENKGKCEYFEQKE